jgi:hypothetical protein
MHFPETSTFKRIAICQTSQMPDGVVVYQRETEKVHYLNPTAAIVYERCGTGQSLGQIADYLKAAFSLAEAPLNEVHRCIESLISERLIEPC